MGFGISTPTSASAAPAERTVDRLQTQARGIHLLWSEGKGDETKILSQPFIHGGQISVQWAEVEPRKGVYDFASLDRKIAALAGKGIWFTVQINGSVKPAWLFNEVPLIPEKLHVQVRDKQGTLVYWYPVFEQAHLSMTRAVAAHLKTSSYLNHMLGVRMNFNAVGTEQFGVPDKYKKPDSWTIPPGCNRDLLKPYSPAFNDSYKDRVVELYKREFSDWTLVLVRNNVDGDVLEKIAPDFRAGRLALFHTSSELEPRTGGTERRYGLFYDFARAGDTVAYAEPWASAWGQHGGKLDDRWCSPCQWNYWTLLFNMHCGVSFIGEYYINLAFAVTGNYPQKPKVNLETLNPKQQQQQFLAAYLWADRYIGRHNRPAETPGAWVAFRENHAVKAANGAKPDNLKLTRFTGDYTFLMTRLENDGSTGVGPVGPADERYGAFARQYPPGKTARLKLDPDFRATLTTGAKLRVIYLDDIADPTATVSLNTPAGEKPLGALPRTATNRWRTAEFDLPPAALANTPADWQFTVAAGEKPLTLHMVEITRPPSAANSKSQSPNPK